MIDPNETKPQTEEEKAAEAEADLKAARDKAERRAARTARMLELKTQIEAWEDRSIIVGHTLEQRKMDLVIMGDSQRGIFLRDEAKKYLNEYTELKKLHLAGMREYVTLETEEIAERAADDKTLRTWGPAIGGFFGGALMNALGRAVSKAGEKTRMAEAASDTVAPEPAPPTEPAGELASENPVTPLGDKQNAP
jgi:hypothetical protein